MNRQLNQLNKTRPSFRKDSQRLTAILAFMFLGTLSGHVQSASIRWNFTDPDLTANGVKACPDSTLGCSFDINVIDFSTDAYVCPNGSVLYPNGTSTPSGCANGLGHFNSGITFSSLGQLTECTKNGSCKIKITDFFLLTDLAAAINAQIPGGGQSVATFQDTYEKCPAVRIQAMTTTVNGFVCNENTNTDPELGPVGQLNADGSCAAGTQGSYYNATAVFDPMFNSANPIDDLCMHGQFSDNVTPDCYDNTAPYTCATTYP